MDAKVECKADVQALLGEISFFLKELTNILTNNCLPSENQKTANLDITNNTTQYQDHCFFSLCLEAHVSWLTGFQERIELAFGFPLSSGSVHADNNSSRYSRQQWSRLPLQIRIEFLIKILVICLDNHGFDARLAYILDQLRQMMNIDPETYSRQVEGEVAAHIIGVHELENNHDLSAQATSRSRLKKGTLIGVSAVLGGVAVGVTAGLAAPAVIPFFASLMGVSAGMGFLTGVTGVALFGTLFGAGGAGLAGYRVGRRYRDISSFRFLPLQSKLTNLRIAIGISGWLAHDEDLYTPWTGLCRPGTDLYVLECEKKAFLELGTALEDLITSSAVSYASFQLLMGTALSTALSALLWPITILQAASFIDNPWSVCLNIAEKAGLVLADVIKSRAHGRRPLTLAGFSLGALIIFRCLMELIKDPASHFGVIENVLLFGLPAEIAPLDQWKKARMLVTGRFIHCYSKNDWVLKFLYRGTSFAIGDLAGLNPIENVDGIENINMSNFVKGHLEYAGKLSEMIELFNL